VSKIVIYSTSPVMKIIGEADVSRTLCGSPEIIWEMTAEESGISQEFFDSYYEGEDTAVAFELNNVVRYGREKDLSKLGMTRAPQSFAYVPDF
jgi:predicted transcriptional regulator